MNAIATLARLAALSPADRTPILRRLSPRDVVALRWKLRREVADLERLIDEAELSDLAPAPKPAP